jgi:protein-disulfide isomerase
LRELGSAPLEPLRAGDHVRGPAGAPLLIVYADFECPYCAVVHEQLRERPLRVAFRHFPVRSKHPRAWAAAGAAEAAARQGAFWPMHDALFADQGRLEDPHLWARAEDLALDLDRFEADRRGDAVAERIRTDFAGGIRAGVVTTPAVYAEGRPVDARSPAGLAALDGLSAKPSSFYHGGTSHG